MTPPIALTMMVRNAATPTCRAMESIRPVIEEGREIVIVDTGSTDDCKTAISTHVASSFSDAHLTIIDWNESNHREDFLLDASESYPPTHYGPIPGPFTNRLFLAEWSKPRQAAADAASAELLVFLDADDIVKDRPKAFFKVASELLSRPADVALLPYEYRHDAEGRVVHEQLRERLWRRGRAKWQGLTHEVLVPEDSNAVIAFLGPTVVDLCDHHDPVNRTPNRAFKILWHAYALGEISANGQMLFQLGLEARKIMPKLALDVLDEATDHLAPVYQALALVEHGFIHENSADLVLANVDYEHALTIAPGLPDVHFAIGRLALRRHENDKAAHHLAEGLRLSVTPKAALIHHDPVMWKGRAHLLLALAMARLGRFKEATDECQAAEPFVPAAEIEQLRRLLVARQQSSHLR